MIGATYETNCVSSDRESITALIDAERTITRRTFLRHVDRASLREIERALGYEAHPSRGLTMAGDCHVTYHASTYQGRACVYFCWSAIEHIFTVEPG